MAIRVYCMPMTGESMIEVMLSSNPPNAAIMVPKPKQRARTLLMRTPMSSGGVRVLGRGPDGLPGTRAHQEDIKGRAENHRDDEGDDAVCREDGPQQIDRKSEVRIALDRRPPDNEGDILDDEEKTEGCEHGIALEDRGRFGGSPQTVIEYAIDDKADGKEERGADNHRKQRGDARPGEERPGAKGAQHDKLAVGYVQYPGHAVLQAEADSNEGVYAAREQAADRYVEEPHNHDKSLLNPVSKALLKEDPAPRLHSRHRSSPLP